MGKNYKLRRNTKSPVKLLLIIVIVIIVIIFMSTGYSLWQSKLNINGNVELINTLEDKKLEIGLNSLFGRYETMTGVGLLTNLEFESDVLTDNKLTSTIRVKRNYGKSTIGITILMNNNNSGKYNYTEGKTAKYEILDSNGAISNNSSSVSSSIKYRSSGIYKQSLSIDLSKISSPTHLTTSISYLVNGEERYFYYTIKILPE